MTYDKTKFVARQPKPNRVMPCGCEQREDVHKSTGYFIWVIVKACEEHKLKKE